MAHIRRTTKENVAQDSVPTPDDQTSLPGVAEISQWLQGSLAAAGQNTVWLAQLQQLWLKSALSWSDIINAHIQELQEVNDLWQLMTTQSTTANRLIDIYATQTAAAQQQIYDSQMLWLGQLDKTVEPAEAMVAPATLDNSALAAWGKVQDDWLQVTRNWIDNMNSSETAH